ncbi:MAG: ectoine/hydroxyectoine ABC transporter permease subunit EhuD [Firmicutes bacterium]|uniref:Amino acid ABC transporter membrane protein 2, PAAT family (TC 3.A.1.3.-) n=1 Tax=Melghirimyces thermohalophilus TaxID=1236220 RepID=A0A1G6MYY2_9BACL|nr:ectoine/hydroxyectoine ABC transporter permease subunit EhuD [Melghirimyces thermohalophilus]MDA8351678.1 ectoine/hydroxyectoine ABC transporter permease subunit EhuD [Bacillota bacterium]SDC60407.1 amino acid ABC transporter membrane protein 2, PAAT family (TC 3.A.1.3.-) [Melghirimyces thermohalophilus]
MAWDWNFTLNEVVPELLNVIHVTIMATLGAFALAVVLGLVLALGCRSNKKWISWPTRGVVEFIRLTPPLVQLFFIFFVFPHLFGLTLKPMVAGILGLGIHYSTYLSEVYRAGIESVPKGQWEAAIALNFSPLQKWKSVILPQAIRPIIPVMGNYLIVLFKETPLLAAIGLMELLGQAKSIGSVTFRYLEPITMVGIIFLILSYTASLLVKRLEWKLDLNGK